MTIYSAGQIIESTPTSHAVPTLEAVKARHRRWHEQLAGAMFVGLPPRCDICWLIEQLELEP